MPRYFFHISAHGNVEYDIEGLDLPDPDAAHREAIAAARDMVVEAVVGDNIIDQREILVVSDDGHLVVTVPLLSVINI